MKRFDLAVLGGGPGGYVAAIRAAKTSNASVVVIEKEHMGGTCLNWGCIPTKTLIASSDVLHQIQRAGDFGITVSDIAIDFNAMVQRKNRVVAQIRANLEKLVAAHRITIMRGHGQLISPSELKVVGKDNEIIHAQKIIIATGSEPRNIVAFPFDHKQILSSSSILDLDVLPKSLLIIGGGVIGCEFASLYQTLGCKVTIIEALDTILPLESKDLSKALAQAFLQRGIEIHTGVRIERIEKQQNQTVALFSDGRKVAAEKTLVAIGRKINTEDIGLKRAGIITTDQGFIEVNAQMETNIHGIYAIGDVTGKMMLAHVASHQGIVAADNALGKSSVMHYNAIPSVIFTRPEAASVGMSVEQAIKLGYKAKSGKFPFYALGKAQAAMETEGFAQVVIDETTTQILGAQVVGHGAAMLIANMGLAIANELTVDSIADTVHAHPTEAESWLEATLMTQDLAIHLPPKK